MHPTTEHKVTAFVLQALLATQSVPAGPFRDMTFRKNFAVAGGFCSGEYMGQAGCELVALANGWLPENLSRPGQAPLRGRSETSEGLR